MRGLAHDALSNAAVESSGEPVAEQMHFALGRDWQDYYKELMNSKSFL